MEDWGILEIAIVVGYILVLIGQISLFVRIGIDQKECEQETEELREMLYSWDE